MVAAGIFVAGNAVIGPRARDEASRSLRRQRRFARRPPRAALLPSADGAERVQLVANAEGGPIPANPQQILEPLTMALSVRIAPSC